jgi:hypothetical protein
MNTLHHKPIKMFQLDGQIHDDAAIGRLKQEYLRLLASEMRLNGYVPRLDIDPDFTIQFNKVTEYFEFKLTTYGVYVGKKKSEWILGIDGIMVVATQANKSSEFFQAQESQFRAK